MRATRSFKPISLGGWWRSGVEVVLLGFFEAGFDDAGGSFGDEGGGVGGFADFRGAEVVAIGARELVAR